eukprot:SAG31_NODE_347_length_17310_cov_3.764743_3_plen_72_part_00
MVENQLRAIQGRWWWHPRQYQRQEGEGGLLLLLMTVVCRNLYWRSQLNWFSRVRVVSLSLYIYILYINHDI